MEFILTIWLIAISLQVAITVLLASQFSKYRKGIPTPSCKISVIIAARDELENLERLVPALLAQTHPDLEVIISLDRCRDGSIDYLERVGDKRLKFIELTDVPDGFDAKKYALTQAVTLAKGTWLVFIDADCLPASHEWLSSINSKMDDKTDILLGYSPYHRNGGLLSTFIQYEGFVTAFHYLSMTLMGKPYMGVGRNMAIRKSFFDRTGGYSDFKSVKGGDDDLFVQKNAKSTNTAVFFEKKALVYTFPKKTWGDYLRQKTRHLSVSTHYTVTDKWTHTVFHGSLLCAWGLIPFVFYQEKLLFFFLFLLVVKLIGYRFAHNKMGVGINYIWFPLVDLMYAIFLPIVAIRSKIVKDIRWKN